ncbi:3-carboxyethylcatechol 2,3-dioxygenase [Oricola nitratireducens]|uniref:3-carboxyethylcatechol 2,3-dioxygenase n=1 Tax=Oricola nitratireducens TaxID=2775868 RepID=UPI001868129D|nr:3-carboxyethylcatechol 2,3-dioxygenase [Oricola nitratireducens]
MIVGSVCISHSPLMDSGRADPETEKRFFSALRIAEEYVAEAEPDLTVVFYPDHINGFFYELMPSFCVGIEGASIGDFGTAAGKLSIPGDTAMDLARSVLNAGVDAAVSMKIEVDHGAMQPIELLSARHDLSNMIPIFINCAAAPRPTLDRVRALGRAVGDWARERPERVLIIGSGGLSHDPPMPALDGASPEVRKRLIEGGALSHAQRHARQRRALAEGANVAAGTSKLLPLNAAWDRKLMDAFVAGDLRILDESSDEEITATGGRGGHEVRTWIAALAALGQEYRPNELFYEAIDNWITGMGVLTADPA